MRNRLVPKRMTLTFVQRSFKVTSTNFNHCVTFHVEYRRNRLRQRLGSNGPPIGNGLWRLWGIKRSPDRRRHVIPKVQTVTPVRLELINISKTAGDAIQQQSLIRYYWQMVQLLWAVPSVQLDIVASSDSSGLFIVNQGSQQTEGTKFKDFSRTSQGPKIAVFKYQKYR